MDDENLTLVGSASHMSEETRDFISLFKNSSLKQVGSSLKFLLVAEGLAHIYPRLAPTCEWDTAAAHIVVTEAGGTVVQAGLCDNKGKALENWKVCTLAVDCMAAKYRMAKRIFLVIEKLLQQKSACAI